MRTQSVEEAVTRLIREHREEILAENARLKKDLDKVRKALADAKHASSHLDGLRQERVRLYTQLVHSESENRSLRTDLRELQDDYRKLQDETNNHRSQC